MKASLLAHNELFLKSHILSSHCLSGGSRLNVCVCVCVLRIQANFKPGDAPCIIRFQHNARAGGHASSPICQRKGNAMNILV